jgi:xeroderma pigmentosum group C-complementing protein
MGGIGLDVDLFGGSQDGAVKPSDDPERLEQVVFRDLDSGTESDADFEDVDLDATVEETFDNSQPEQAPVEVTLSKPSTTPSRTPRRKPVSAKERRLRLAVHKTHIVMLLAHLKTRNLWCNSEILHATLKSLVTRKTINLLHVDDSKPQYERNQSFMKALEALCDLWRGAWTNTEPGLQRPYWRDDLDTLKHDAIEFEDLDFEAFKAAASSRQGSRDLGAQLFCTLLRSVAVDTRLICSLQVLPFSGVAKEQTPEAPKPEYIYAPEQTYNDSNVPTTSKKRHFEESYYPVFWVEVFNPAVQTWMPIDPLVRGTINKPKTGFEPPASDAQNRLAYVIAFEDDGSAKDVTRRYAQFYNSKTSKYRVEATPHGEKWWSDTIAALEKTFREPRDDIEDAFLLKRAEAEPMPTNIQDFRGHSIYVLERHLHQNQVIHPRREAGKVNVGGRLTTKLESVFRRKDVHVCRTADAWYRRGRDVKEGEQPLKRVLPKRRKEMTTEDFEDHEEASEGSALYAEFQTHLYVPPPVIDGRIPRNAFGNLDVYVPSMIPPGAVHVRHHQAAQAARVLGINYVEAVTGFQFKGRKGTAVLDGVVVSMGMTNAMITVIEGLMEQVSEEVQEARSRVVLATWKRWLMALRIREHVKTQYGNGDQKGRGKEIEGADDEDEDETYNPDDNDGGFLLEVEEPNEDDGECRANLPPPPAAQDFQATSELMSEVVHQEIIVVRSPHNLPKQEIPINPLKQRSAQKVSSDNPSKHTTGRDTGGRGIVPDEDGTGGGFLPGDEEHGGGFLLDDGQDTHMLPAPTATESVAAKAREDISEAGGILPEEDTDAEEANGATFPRGTNDHLQVPLQSIHEDGNGKGKTQSTEGTPGSTPGSRLSHDPDEDDEPDWLEENLA